jgi:hypothetical protein
VIEFNRCFEGGQLLSEWLQERELDNYKGAPVIEVLSAGRARGSSPVSELEKAAWGTPWGTPAGFGQPFSQCRRGEESLQPLMTGKSSV